MKVSLLYRTASVLLLLFAAGHTIGFRQVDIRYEREGTPLVAHALEITPPS